MDGCAPLIEVRCHVSKRVPPIRFCIPGRISLTDDMVKLVVAGHAYATIRVLVVLSVPVIVCGVCPSVSLLLSHDCDDTIVTHGFDYPI